MADGYERKARATHLPSLKCQRESIDSLPTAHYQLFAANYLLLATHYSLLTTHYSLLTTHHPLLTIHYSLLTTYYSLLTTHHSLLTTHYSPLTTHYTLPTTHNSALLTTNYPPLTTHYPLLTTYSSLHTTYCALLTTDYPLLTTDYSLLTTHYPLPTVHYSLLILTTRYSLPTTHYQLFAADCLLLATHYPLLTTHYSLLITYHPLLTTHYSLFEWRSQICWSMDSLGGLLANILGVSSAVAIKVSFWSRGSLVWRVPPSLIVATPPTFLQRSSNRRSHTSSKGGRLILLKYVGNTCDSSSPMSIGSYLGGRPISAGTHPGSTAAILAPPAFPSASGKPDPGWDLVLLERPRTRHGTTRWIYRP